MKIKKIVNEDVAKLLGLTREVREHHRVILNGYFKPQDDDIEASCIKNWVEDEKNICLLAEDSGEIKGFILGEAKINAALEKPRIIMIHNFVVAEKRRGQGIGKQLMQRFYQECQDKRIQEIKLGVFNKNKSAYAFYENFGFEAQEQKMSLKVAEKSLQD